MLKTIFHIHLLKFFPLFILISCSSPIDLYVTGNKHEILVENLPLEDGRSVTLESAERRHTFAHSRVQNGTAKFRINSYLTINSCFFVRPSGGSWNLTLYDYQFQNPVAAKFVNSANEIAVLKSTINQDSANLYRRAQNWLISHPHVFQDGMCNLREAPVQPKPSNACEPSRRGEYAQNECVNSFVSCYVASEAANEIFGSGAALIASQACNAFQASRMGTSYDLSSAMMVLANDVSLARLKSSLSRGSDVGTAIWSSGVGALVLTAFDQCVRDVSFHCSRQYDSWKNSPSTDYHNCVNFEKTVGKGDPNANIYTQIRNLEQLRDQANRSPLVPLLRC